MRRLLDILIGAAVSLTLVTAWDWQNKGKEEGPVSIIIEDEPIIIVAGSL